MAALLAEMHKRGAADDALTADIVALLSRFAAAGIVIDTARPQPPALRLTEREQQTLRLIASGTIPTRAWRASWAFRRKPSNGTLSSCMKSCR
ncbi:hypothetical protein QYS46_27495 [Klebsiella michiganensis]|nr:hypothetical protein [Klebsiella michiganensis]